MVHAYQFPPIVEYATATQGVHRLRHRRSTSINQIGNVLLSERYLERVTMWARSPKHQGEFAQGFNESCLDFFGEDSDKFPFRPFLPSFELGAEERGERWTVAYETAQVVMGDFGYANFTQRCRRVFRCIYRQRAPEYAARSQHVRRQLNSSFRDVRKFDDTLQQPKQTRQSVALSV